MKLNYQQQTLQYVINISFRGDTTMKLLRNRYEAVQPWEQVLEVKCCHMLKSHGHNDK